jgi:hypothetical protein
VTSSTTATIANSGNFTFTVNKLGAFIAGDRVRVIESSRTRFIEGLVIATTSNSITLTSDYSVGSGTFSSWFVSLTGQLGSQGYQGAAGTNGTNGTNGTAATINVQGTQTVPYTQGAQVVNNGTQSAANFQFYLPQGPQGATGAQGAGGTVANYGQFYSTQNQTAAAANTGYPVTFNNTDIHNNVQLATGSQSRVQVLTAGTYNFQFSIQFLNTVNQIYNAYVWFRKNGTDVPASDSIFAVPAKHSGQNGESIGALNFMLNMSANDYVELIWSVENTAVSLEYLSGSSSDTNPSTPSAIFTAEQLAYSGAQGAQGPQGAQGSMPAQVIFSAAVDINDGGYAVVEDQFSSFPFLSTDVTIGSSYYYNNSGNIGFQAPSTGYYLAVGTLRIQDSQTAGYPFAGGPSITVGDTADVSWTVVTDDTFSSNNRTTLNRANVLYLTANQVIKLVVGPISGLGGDQYFGAKLDIYKLP